MTVLQPLIKGDRLVSEVHNDNEIYARLLTASALLEESQVKDLLARAQGQSLRDLVQREAILSDAQREVLDQLADNPSVNIRVDDPLLAQLGFLKQTLVDGEVDKAFLIFDKLLDHAVYARLGELLFRRAALKQAQPEELLGRLENRLSSVKFMTKASAKEEVKVSSAGFSDFLEIKKAVTTQNVEKVLELERKLRDDVTYSRAAFQLAQKVLLNRALAEKRKDDDLKVIKCPQCNTAFAMARGSSKKCDMCGAEFKLKPKSGS